jgi:hypothetical protein
MAWKSLAFNIGSGQMGKSPKKVAVIAIHGIADQKPNGSAKEISNLLTKVLPKESEGSYSELMEPKEIEVHVEKLLIKKESLEGPGKGEAQQNKKFWEIPNFLKLFLNYSEGLFDERGENFKREINQSGGNYKEADYLFIKDQIYKHKVRRNYKKFTTQRISLHYQASEKSLDADVYEMYWADLSRLGKGFISIIGNFYQLLFHLTSLGRQCVDYARYNSLKSESQCQDWWIYSQVQAIASRMLTLVIPILNIFILISGLICLPTQILQNFPTQIQEYIILLTIELILIIFAFLLYFKCKSKLIRVFISVFLFVCGILIVFGHHFLQETVVVHIYPFLKEKIQLHEYMISRLSSLVLIVILLWLVQKVYIVPYDRHRKGVVATFAILRSSFLMLVLATYLHGSRELASQPLTISNLRIMEILYISLFLVWGLLLLFYAVAFIVGIIVVNRSTSEEQKQIHKKTTWTARVSLALPITLFSLLTPSLWIVMAYTGEILWPHVPYHSLLFNSKPLLPSEFALALAILPGSGIRFQFFVLVLILVLSLLFAFSRSLRYEDSQILDDNKDKTEEVKNLGDWLDRGFGVIVIGIEIFLNSFIPALLLIKCCTVFRAMFLHSLTPDTNPNNHLAVLGSGIIVASLIAFQKYLWGFLDLILDVDNYLRSRPIDDTPTGRIFARYSSLLREICKETEDGKNKYDKIVIVAHSQGTVITADLLRFLAKENNLREQGLEKLEKIPIYLFTMGSPLRQLYNFGFPTLYHWVKGAESELKTNSKVPIKGFPKELEKWVNAYRSGDYVGRYIWRSSDASDLWTPGKITASTTDINIQTEEFCIGVGAHNHYWDEHALQIAKKLDELIQESIQDKNNSHITS